MSATNISYRNFHTMRNLNEWKPQSVTNQSKRRFCVLILFEIGFKGVYFLLRCSSILHCINALTISSFQWKVPNVIIIVGNVVCTWKMHLCLVMHTIRSRYIPLIFVIWMLYSSFGYCNMAIMIRLAWYATKTHTYQNQHFTEAPNFQFI